MPILSFNWEIGKIPDRDEVLNGCFLIDNSFAHMPDSQTPSMRLFFQCLRRILIEHFNPSGQPSDTWQEVRDALAHMSTIRENLNQHRTTDRGFAFERYNPTEFLSFLGTIYGERIPALPEKFHTRNTIVHKNNSKQFRSDPYIGVYSLYALTRCLNNDNSFNNLVAFWENTNLSWSSIERQYRKIFTGFWRGDLNIPLENWLSANRPNKLVKSSVLFLDGLIFKDGGVFKSEPSNPLFLTHTLSSSISGSFPNTLNVENVLENLEIDEEEVAFAVRDELIESDWEILVFNPPRGKGGFDLLTPESGLERAFGAKLPDLIAFKNNFLIILEFKVDFDIGDIEKLRSLTQNDIITICQEYDLSNTLKDIRGIGISGFSPEHHRDLLPDDYIAFNLDRESRDTEIFCRPNANIEVLFRSISHL